MTMLLIPDRALPVVSLSVLFPVGSGADPEGREGLAHLAAQMVLRGAGGLSREEQAHAFEELGAFPTVVVANDFIQLTADCAREDAAQLVELVGQAVRDPLLSAPELARLKRQLTAEMVDLRDSDSDVAAAAHHQALFAGVLPAHPPQGFQASRRRVTVGDVRRFHRARLTGEEALVGFAGDLSRLEARRLAGRLGGGRRFVAPLPRAVVPGRSGVRVLHMVRAGRTQATVLIGHAGPPARSPLYLPGRVAVAAFGEVYSSPLVQEVRERRGWSYGVDASLHAGSGGSELTVRLAPANEQALPALRLALELLERLAGVGPRDEEVAVAREQRVLQHPFQVETPAQRLRLELGARLLGLGARHVSGLRERYLEVTGEQARRAIRTMLARRAWQVTVLGAEELAPDLLRLPGLISFTQVPYDHDGPLPAPGPQSG